MSGYPRVFAPLIMLSVSGHSSKSGYVLVNLPLSTENLYKPLFPQPIKILCYSAIADLFKYLAESKAKPQDLAARQKLQLASWMSMWPLKLDKSGLVDIILPRQLYSLMI
jgi:hypothetical protein